MRPSRLILALIAIALCAWFAIGIRQAHDTAKATAILSGSGPLSPSQLRAAAGALRGAKLLNPDTEVAVLRGQLALREGNAARAQRIFEDAGRQEPRNIEAWAWLARAAGSNHALIRLALDNIARLEPKVAPAP